MNQVGIERISQLYDQSLIVKDNGDSVEGDLDFVKFAELIVKECIDTLDQIPVYYKNENDREIERNTISDCIHAIQQRFGVE